MTATSIERLLADPTSVMQQLSACGVHSQQRGFRNIVGMARSGVTWDLLDSLYRQLVEHLPAVSDPDMALNNLERFVTSARSPLALASLLQRDPTAMPILLKIFSTSQYLTDVLINDRESYDALRLTEGQPIARDVLVDELSSELLSAPLHDPGVAMNILRRFKQRETLRIAFGDLIAQQDLQTVTRQISYLAEALCQGALDYGRRRLNEKYGLPNNSSGQPARVVVLAMGKLGGLELNYSSDIDLAIVFDVAGTTSGPVTTTNQDYFDRLGREFVKLLTENTSLGVAYRVDLRLRPGGDKAPIATPQSRALSYYDLQGRTWERQALVKARPIAGDLELGKQLLQQLDPWIYSQSLSLTDIQSIQSLKRQIERRAVVDGQETLNVKTGRGGIRDIEFAIQFLQLLHGHESQRLRTGNTLEAISRLYETGCISSQEQILLDRGYRWLRKLEHRLQIMFDLQTHSLPGDPGELEKVALRMDYGGDDALTDFNRDLHQISEHNRRILDHLLHNAFVHTAIESSAAVPDGSESDLVLGAEPDPSQIAQVLTPYGFAEPARAYRHLTELATEKNAFLSARRCRHFLAAIAASLLAEISHTPNPDATLRTLNRVSESLGGKAVLWELFSSHPPSMNLFVRLCAASPYLCDILISYPGMIDGLMDSLLLQELPSRDFLTRMLADLMVGAEDIEPIIHSFKNAQHLRVGVRDILGSDRIPETHRALADIAEVCISEIAEWEQALSTQRFGIPRCDGGRVAPLIILALGKLGGREPNYQSDLDLIFLYDGDGPRPTEDGPESTSQQDFFGRLAANITKRISATGRHGRLYEIDNRLRPTGKSGSLAVSFSGFSRYFASGGGQLWERLALCRARPIYCSVQQDLENAFGLARSLVANAITLHPWQPSHAREIFDMRIRMQAGTSPLNLKRGVGGTVDIEFAVQMLQLKYAGEDRGVLVPGTLPAARQLHAKRYLPTDDFEFLCQSYEMLRWVEARIGLMGAEQRHDLPETPESLKHLAFLLRYDDHQRLVEQIDYLRGENRRRLERLIEIHSK